MESLKSILDRYRPDRNPVDIDLSRMLAGSIGIFTKTRSCLFFYV